MKLIADYPERSADFERMADNAGDPALKEQLHKQAEAYRKLAEQRAARLGKELPPRTVTRREAPGDPQGQAPR